MFVLWTLLAATVAQAQDPAYNRTAAVEDEVEKPDTELSAELGFTNSVGNAFFISVNGGIRFAHRWKQNRFSAFAGTNLNLARLDANGNGTAADEKAPLQWTSQRAFGGLRYDRFFGQRDAIYVSGGGEHDKLAGLLWRFNQQFGYSRVVVDTERTRFTTEFGLSYNEENFVTVTDADGTVRFAGVLDAHYLAFRAFFGLTHAFSDTFSFANHLELIEPLVAFREGVDSVTNFEDFRFVNVLELTAKVSDRFSLKISDRLAFDNQPPSPEFSKVDNTVMITLVATLL